MPWKHITGYMIPLNARNPGAVLVVRFQVWDLTANKSTQIMKDLDMHPIQSLSVATDASLVVGANNKGTVYVLSLGDDKKASVLLMRLAFDGVSLSYLLCFGVCGSIFYTNAHHMLGLTFVCFCPHCICGGLRSNGLHFRACSRPAGELVESGLVVGLHHLRWRTVAVSVSVIFQCMTATLVTSIVLLITSESNTNGMEPPCGTCVLFSSIY